MKLAGDYVIDFPSNLECLGAGASSDEAKRGAIGKSDSSTCPTAGVGEQPFFNLSLQLDTNLIIDSIFRKTVSILDWPDTLLVLALVLTSILLLVHYYYHDSNSPYTMADSSFDESDSSDITKTTQRQIDEVPLCQRRQIMYAYSFQLKKRRFERINAVVTESNTALENVRARVAQYQEERRTKK